MGNFPKLLGQLYPVAIPPTGGASSLGVNPLPLAIPDQQLNNWCWCAVGAGIGDYLNGTTTVQCSFASTVLGMPPDTCCGTGNGGPCDKAWYLDRALTTAGCLDRVDDTRIKPTSFADVSSEIGDDQPLGVRIQWQTIGAHFIAIAGYQISSTGEELVTVQDPYGPVTATVPIDDLHGSYGTDHGNWTHSYFTAKLPMGGGSAAVDDSDLLGG